MNNNAEIYACLRLLFLILAAISSNIVSTNVTVQDHFPIYWVSMSIAETRFGGISARQKIIMANEKTVGL